jgi:glycosyltransferase involved in cell wall biosynthesis
MFDLNIRGAALDRRPLNGFVTGIVHFCAPALLSKRTKEKWHLRIAYLLAKRRETPFVFSFDKMFIEKGPRYIVNNWRWVPDPLPVNREQLQRLLLASPSSGKDHVEFLLFGSLGRRKGLFSVLEALERLALSTAKRVSVRILGEYSEGGTNEREHFLEIISRIQSKGIVGLRFEERFATEDELIEALIDCDVVLAPYLHHSGVSAALIWAAAAGRPIITQDSGWIAHETSTNKLGLMCDPTDSVKLASAIAQMVNQEDRRNLWPPDRLHKFAEMHTPDHFYSSIIEQLVLFE